MESFDRFSAGGIRWRAAPGHGTLLRDFDVLMATGRVVKNYRFKRTVEVSASGRSWFVKCFRPGGMLRNLKARLLGSKASHELKMYQGVVARGLPTIRLVAVGERGSEGYVVVEKLEGWGQLHRALLGPGDHRRLLESYGRFARRLHDTGVWQYDFNPSNILVSASGEMRVIDFEKMKLVSSVSESSRLRALTKMNRIAKLSRADRLRFLRAYYHDRPVHEIARRILAMGERQLRRDAARFARNSVRENRNFGRFRSGWYRKRNEDYPGLGLTLQEAERLAPGDGFRFEPADRAIDAWKTANERSRMGGPTPVAVVCERGRKRGCVVYPIPP